MPVAEYAEKMAAGETVTDAMTPDKVVDLLVEMAEEGLGIAEKASKGRHERTKTRRPDSSPTAKPWFS